jgi:hypothetical protein
MGNVDSSFCMPLAACQPTVAMREKSKYRNHQEANAGFNTPKGIRERLRWLGAVTQSFDE